MEKPENRFVSVVYQLYTIAQDGSKQLEEQTGDERPFEFITGFGVALDRFEEELMKHAKGDSFDFTLEPAEAFGDYVPEGKHQLGREIFTVNGKFGMVDTLGPLAYTVHLSSPVTRVWVKVQAFSADRRLMSQSNVVEIERLTSDTADFVEITSVEYDSIRIFNHLVFNTDTSYPTDHYTLLRSIDGSPWREVATLEPPVLEYIDRDINPYDSLHCYLLAVNDACGMNPKYSPVECIVVPTPPEPSVYFPNAILAGDPANGTFLPVIRGLQGTLYELHIYNRQGMLVYHTTDPTRGWTPPADTPQGVYTYRLRCRFNTNFVKQYLGTVLLIK